MTQSNVVNIGSSPNDGTGDPLRIAFANINVQFANLFTNYQLSSALSSNVITLTANNTNFVGLVTAANVVSNAQLIANLANYVLTSSLSGQGYQTVAGLPANVATLTANNASYLGGTAAASYALSSTLSNYQTTAGLSANVATVTANNTSFVGSVSAVNVVSNAQLTANLANYTNTAGLSVYQTTAGLSTNVATLTSNNTNYVGFVAAVNVVSNAQLSANLSLYAALSGSAFTGAVTFSNTISVTGNTRFSNTLLVTGNVSFANTLLVTGNATFSNTVTVSGTVAMGSSFKRNRIINGNMLVWQRGTTGFATTDTYCADRWIAKADTTFTSASQSTDAPSGFKYSLSVSGTGYAGAYQRIEALNCTDLSGQTVTISFWAKQASGAGTNSLSVAIYYPNSADVYSGGVTQLVATQYATGSSSWARYSFIFTGLPSGVLNGMSPYILSNVAGASTILITGVQIEVGTVATPYEMQIYSDQLAQCQRYYVDSNPGSATAAYTNIQYSLSGAGWPIGTISLPVTMRTAPTISTRNVTLTNASGLVIGSVFPNYFYGSVSVSVASSYTVSLNYTASAEL